MAKYTPPHQSKFGQIFDVFVLLVLIIGALRIPLLMDLAGGAKTTPDPVATATWADLGQDTPEKVAAYNALGYTDPTNADLQALIMSRFDYWSFQTWELILMIIVVIGYFIIVIRLSDNEYRDVIAEKFGDRK
jgi:hypothetical protein